MSLVRRGRDEEPAPGRIRARALKVVVEYCLDPRKVYAADPTYTVTTAAPGPNGVGTTALLRTRTPVLRESVAIEYVEVDLDRRIVFEARSTMSVAGRTFGAEVFTWTWTFEPADGGTTVTVVGVNRGVAPDIGRLWKWKDVALADVDVKPDGVGTSARMYTHLLAFPVEGGVEYTEVVPGQLIVAQVHFFPAASRRGPGSGTAPVGGSGSERNDLRSINAPYAGTSHRAAK